MDAQFSRHASQSTKCRRRRQTWHYLNLVYFAALRQVGGDAHRAEDVTQTVFALLARKASSLTRHQTLAGWLHTTTRFTASEALRAERRRLAREQEAHTMHELSTDSAAGHEWEQLRPVIDDALGELREPDREAVLLRFFANLPFAEVGAKLNLSENTARMRVERALDKLRVLLARRGITSTTAALSTALANQAMAAAPASLAATVTGAALSGAAAGAVATTGFIMSTTNLITAVVAVVAIGGGVFQVNRTHRVEVELAALTRDRDGLRAQLSNAQQQAAQTEQEFAALRGEMETLRASNAATSTPGRAAPATVDTATAQRRAEETALSRAQQEVEARRAKRASRSVVNVSTLDTAYRALDPQLNFSPEQIARFKALAVENARRHEELDKLAAAQGMRVTDPAMQALYSQTDAEFGFKVSSSFGADALQTVQHYGDTLPLRVFVEQLAGRLFYTDTPLVAAQANQLVEILSNNMRTAKGQIDTAALDAAAILAQAQSTLSAPQLERFHELVAKFAAEGEAQKKSATAAGIYPSGNR
ncbi:MAG: sigma-70 family RNA polymerase sigma factor [Verrucomicrobia bacterium]|nr:sigma-70 family RNA polymerase sigma factor [Verrucomicrobiota bacterium]